MNEIRLPYKPNKLAMILAMVVLVGLSVFAGYTAMTNQQGLIVMKVIEFGVDGATKFFWFLSLLLAAAAAMGIFTLIKSAGQDREIVITDSSITSPKSGMSNQDVTVQYSDISNITVQSVPGSKFLQIVHPGGKLSIPNSMLPNKAAFEELISTVETKLGAFHAR